MPDFISTMLREKFTIIDRNNFSHSNSTVALSNRIVLNLQFSGAQPVEHLVIRGHNMHSVVRMAARIYNEFHHRGASGYMFQHYDWDLLCDNALSDYECITNPKRWITIYYKGHALFSRGQYHPFLDMMELCDKDHNQDYELAIPKAQNLLKRTGKNLEVKYDTNVALTLTFDKRQGRCGIILRGIDKASTFNFSARCREHSDRDLNISQCMGSAAAFLEGVQLAYTLGSMAAKPENTRNIQFIRDGKKRLMLLSIEIEKLERDFQIRYRPEKPIFLALLAHAESAASSISH